MTHDTDSAEEQFKEASAQMHPPTATRSYSSILLAVSNVGVFIFPFLRGVILARLLSPQDFGQAISITTVASVVDIISDVGLYQYAVRVSSAAALPTLHSISLIRGVFIAAIIVLCSPLCAYLFDAPGTAWAYAAVGLAPLIRGLYHLSVKTAMRSFDFAKEAITELVGQAVWMVVSIAAAFILHDYRAMIIGVVANAISIVGMTHFLSKTRWTLGWDRTVVKDAARFGRPLIPNGAATVLVTMGDRTIVGSYLGLDALASYSVLTTSAFLPRSALLRYLNTLMTPQFVHASVAEDVDRLLVKSAIMLSAIGGFFAFGYMALGQPVIAAVFGKHYAVSQEIVSLIGILSCIRFISAITTPIGLAKGKTGLVFLNTATSGIGLGLGVLFMLHSRTLEAMVGGMCVGELGALIYIVAKLLASNRASASGVWAAIAPTLVLAIACSAVFYAGGLADTPQKSIVSCGFTVAEIAVLGGVMISKSISIKNIAGLLLPKRLQALA